jgi:hypothetical protein
MRVWAEVSGLSKVLAHVGDHFERPFTLLQSRIAAIATGVLAIHFAVSGLEMWPEDDLVAFALLVAFIPLFTAMIRGPMWLQWVSGAMLATIGGWLANKDDRAVAGVLAIAAGLLLTWIEARRGLRRAAVVAALRDWLWRTAGTLAAAIAALGVANRFERAVFEETFATPLEGLSLPAAIFVGVLTFIALAGAVWALPRIAAKRMSDGVVLPSAPADALWIGALATVAALVFDVRAIPERGVFHTAAGTTTWIAFAAVLAFAAMRLGFRGAVSGEVQALWILLLGGQASLRGHAATLAARWRNGPVTLVAAPEAALSCGGTHLRLAQLRDHVEPLFPRRAVHFADWEETHPPRDRWQALPIRELYAPAALWPELFESRLEPDALVVVIHDREPEAETIADLRRVLPTNRTDFHLPVGQPASFERWPGVEVYPIVGRGESGVDRWIAGNAIATNRRLAPRIALIAHSDSDRKLAMKLRDVFIGKRDRIGRRVFADSTLLSWSFFARLRGSSLFGQTLTSKSRYGRGGWWGDVMGRLVSFGLPADTEYDVLVIEGPVEVAAIEKVLDRRSRTAASRIIAALPAGQQPVLNIYTHLIPIPATPDIGAQANEIAARYLALEFEAVPVAASSDGRPRVFLSYDRDHWRAAIELEYRLRGTWDIQRLESLGASLDASVRDLIAAADIVVAIGRIKTATRATEELELAAQMKKPVFRVNTGMMMRGRIGDEELDRIVARLNEELDSFRT